MVTLVLATRKRSDFSQVRGLHQRRESPGDWQELVDVSSKVSPSLNIHHGINYIRPSRVGALHTRFEFCTTRVMTTRVLQNSERVKDFFTRRTFVV